jgi:hypothetical protein
MLLCGSANISHNTFRLGLIVVADRSASQIRNPGVTPGFFVERTDDAPMSAFGPSAIGVLHGAPNKHLGW